MPVYDDISILFERHRQLNADGNFAGIYDLGKHFTRSSRQILELDPDRLVFRDCPAPRFSAAI
jgi:hypothetical protein